MLMEYHMNIIIKHACPCFRMLIEAHMNIIDIHTSALLPYAYRRSYEQSS